MGDKVIVEIVLADVGLTESQQDVLARGLQASAHRHAEDHFFTYLKWSLDIMRDTALSVSKESITEAGVKQAQSGEKQKKMKESTLDNKKIKATSELNVAAIESKGVLFSKFFESPNNCKKVALIASKLMTWKPEDVQKLFHEISKIEGIDKIPSSALEMTTLWSLSVDNVLRFIRRAATEKLTRDQCRQLFQSIQDSYHIYSLVKDFISALDSDDKEQRSFSKTQLRVLKNAVRSGWLSDYVDCPASDFELQMGPVTAAIMWGKLTKESEINAASKNMEKNSILSEKPVMVNWNELVYPAKVYKEVSLEFSRCMDRCCTNFFLRDCWTQCYGLYKSFRPNIMLVDMSALQSPDDLRDYIPKLNPLVIPLIPTGEHVWDQTPNRHIHYNLVVNFLSSKARDKFTSLLKSTFLALKSDPLELLHGSSKPTIDYTTVHDLLHFMSIAALELTGDKPMHRYLTEISFEHSLLEIGAPFGLAPLRWALRSRAGDSDKDEPAAAAAVTDDISITKGKSSSVTKKQKPKASTASAVISPTPQSHAELETTDKDPEEHADKNKDSEKPDEPDKPGETEKPDETELPEEPEPAMSCCAAAAEESPAPVVTWSTWESAVVSAVPDDQAQPEATASWMLLLHDSDSASGDRIALSDLNGDKTIYAHEGQYIRVVSHSKATRSGYFSTGVRDVTNDSIPDFAFAMANEDTGCWDLVVVTNSKWRTVKHPLSETTINTLGWLVMPTKYTVAKTALSIGALGDHNGDRVNDVLVGVLGQTGDGVRAMVLLGPDLSAVSFVTGLSGDTSSSVSALGDVDGDGLSDFGLETHGNTERYRAFIVFGSADISRGAAVSIDGMGWTAKESYGSGRGANITGIGDINGDGMGDVAVAMAQCGWLRVVLGSADRNLSVGTGVVLTSGSRSSGTLPGDSQCADVLLPQALGDVNGDLVDDLGVGLPQQDLYNLKEAGVISVMLGSRSPDSWIHKRSGPFDMVGYEGPFLGRYFGKGGDIDGDGSDDLVIGMPADSNASARTFSGTVVVLGSQQMQLIATSLDTSIAIADEISTLYLPGLSLWTRKHAKDHFFTYLKWSLNMVRDMAQSVSKESIMEARVKQVQAGKKQKKKKESMLDNKKIKLLSKFFESQINCKKVVLIMSKLMT
eukprot:m51a1_g8933 hypothetical protein (1145) ;mRNA; f:876332-888957